LGQPRDQAVIYTVWISGILIGAVLVFIFAFLIGGDYKGRTQTTAREAVAPLYQPVVLSPDGTKIAQAEAWKAQGDQGTKELQAAVARGHDYYNRICIGCHYGSPVSTVDRPSNGIANGAYLGDLYQQGYLYNGQPLNDANLVKFILLGHGNMPAGIAVPQQAVDLTLFLKAQTCGTPTTDAQKLKCS